MEARMLEEPCNFRGNVEYCLEFLLLLGALGVAAGCGIRRGGSKATVTTTSLTRSPDFRMRPTTVSWLACLTS